MDLGRLQSRLEPDVNKTKIWEIHQIVPTRELRYFVLQNETRYK